MFLSPVTLLDACKAAMVVQAAGLCSCLVLAVASVRGLRPVEPHFPLNTICTLTHAKLDTFLC